MDILLGHVRKFRGSSEMTWNASKTLTACAKDEKWALANNSFMAVNILQLDLALSFGYD